MGGVKQIVGYLLISLTTWVFSTKYLELFSLQINTLNYLNSSS